MSLISWSADPKGVLPGGRCHTSGDAVVQWAVWHDLKGRRCQHLLTTVGDLPEPVPYRTQLSPKELAYAKELVRRL